MAESFPSLGKTILEGSDQTHDRSCEPRLEANVKVKKANVSKSDQKSKRPTYIKAIDVQSPSDYLWGSVVIQNKQILITDNQNKKLKLIDTHQKTTISVIQLPGNPFDVTKVKENEVAVTVDRPESIQFIYVSKNSMSIVREIPVKTKCWGITYNDRDNTLIVAFEGPKIAILDMAGTEMKCFENGPNGDKLFKKPYYVAFDSLLSNIYVTDYLNDTVTVMSLNGDVKAVYKDTTNSVFGPYGICVHKSGLVYVVGSDSNTIHVLDPDSGEFKVILAMKDSLSCVDTHTTIHETPLSISYCETEDKIYIGMVERSVMKIYQMK